MTDRFADRAYLVTGSTRGIGRAIAQRIVDEGGMVMIHGRDQAEAEETAHAIGGKTRAVGGDLADAATPEAIVKATEAAFGRLDGLVNNAGIYPRHHVEDATAEVFDHIFAVNARAPLLSCKAAIAAFRKRGAPGSVVTIGSINGWSGLSELPVYSMSKGALMTMTRNLADTFGRERIRFTCLNVGWVGTEQEIALQVSLGAPPDWAENVPEFSAPIGRLQKPEEIAAHACFWLSDDSAPATGQCYEVEQFPLIGRMKAPQR